MLPVFILLALSGLLLVSSFTSVLLEISDSYIYLNKKMAGFEINSKRILISDVCEWTGNGIDNYTRIEFSDSQGRRLKMGGMDIAKLEFIIGKFEKLKSQIVIE